LKRSSLARPRRGAKGFNRGTDLGPFLGSTF
jgi:hypothetical protein